ncbi:MAG: hypothetical protein ACOC8F_04465 [Planctomycetota bacterium]
MVRTLSVILTVAGLLTPAAGQAPGDGGGAQPAAPGTRPSATERFDALLKQVRDAQAPEAVASAYAEANTLHPRAQVLHTAYLKRMLRFGLVTIAAHPARTLLRIDPDHALAHGTLAYLHGREGRRAEALGDALVAAAKLRRNAGVLSNLGQLVAWYDHAAPTPELAPAARRRLEKLREPLSKQKAYDSAYKRVAAAYAQRDEKLAALTERLERAEDAVSELKAPLADLYTRLGGLVDEIEYREEIVDDLEDELRFDFHFDPYTGRFVRHHDHDFLLRQRLYDERRRLARLRREAHDVQARIAGLRTELEQRRDRLDAIRRKRDELDRSPAAAFRWDPPAVGGEITPAVEHPGQVWRPTGSTRPRQTRPRPEQRLDIARLYLANDMPDKAREVLREVAAQKVSEEAAAEARKLLGRIGDG